LDRPIEGHTNASSIRRTVRPPSRRRFLPARASQPWRRRRAGQWRGSGRRRCISSSPRASSFFPGARAPSFLAASPLREIVCSRTEVSSAVEIDARVVSSRSSRLIDVHAPLSTLENTFHRGGADRLLMRRSMCRYAVSGEEETGAFLETDDSQFRDDLPGPATRGRQAPLRRPSGARCLGLDRLSNERERRVTGSSASLRLPGARSDGRERDPRGATAQDLAQGAAAQN